MDEQNETCVCGHTKEEHGDSQHPACMVETCECPAFEASGDPKLVIE